MPVSIVDYESLIKDPLSLGMFQNLRRMNDILKLFPVVEVGSLVVRGEKWATLPSHAFRSLNEDFTDSTGTTEPEEERLAIAGGMFKVDKAYGKLKTPLYRDPTQQQLDMHNKGLNRFITHNMINGDVDADPKGFEGLFKRFASGDFAAAQVVSASGTTDSLKVLASATNAQQFFDKLDEAIYQAGLFETPESNTARGALLMNKTSFLAIQAAARLTGYSINVRDLLGYTWTSYRNLPFVDVGLKSDQSTEIIGNAYNPGDGGNDSSRILVVRFSEADGDIESPGSDGCAILQAGGYEVLGPEDHLTYEYMGIQWIMGIGHIGDEYAAAMLDDFKMADS
jgi:hypothetical protein